MSVTSIIKEPTQNNPQVSEYTHDINQSIAERAFMNTSFSPEKRGVNVRSEYAESLLIDKIEVLDKIIIASKKGADLSKDHDVMVDEWFKSHRERLRDCYISWLHSHARVASSFIVGPANFPVARNQKLSNYADAKLLAIDEFRKKSIKSILRRVLPYGDGASIQTDDPNASEKIENKIASLENQREEMKAINKLIRKYFKNENPEISPEKLAEFKDIMQSKFVIDEEEIIYIMKPDYTGKITGFKKWELQNLSANINRYKKRLAEVKKTQSVSINQEFSNGIRVSISEDQKICIHFGFKPCEEIRSLLKANAFKFSRNRENAWVRKYTLNAAYSYVNFVKPKLEMIDVI